MLHPSVSDPIEEERVSIPIIDTHEHLWDLGARPHSWTDDIPPLKKSFLPADYTAATDGSNITRSIHMEADVDDAHADDENTWIASLAVDPANPICGAIISGRPEEEEFDTYLERWGNQDFVKGVRRVLHVMPDETSQSDLFVANIRRLAAFDLPFDLCFLERQLPIAIQLVEKCPETTFVLDHCGVPSIAEGKPEAWQGHIKELSMFANINCKVSGLVAYANPEKSIEDAVKPYIDYVIESFGWDRLIFGSDWPVCTITTTAAEWIRIARDHVRSAPETDQHKLFHNNAARIYNL